MINLFFNTSWRRAQIARMFGIAPVTLYRIEKYQAEDLANVPRSER
ncbi:hypothetical protein [Lacticaseibacillus paracasei]|nr:hypothetical protein [Lacticaseibacillus paracasei]